MKKCKVCGELTDTVFNINLKATPICEECARRIFLQQATWYTQQEFKNLALPQVSKCEEFERDALLLAYAKWRDEIVVHRRLKPEELVKEFLSKQ